MDENQVARASVSIDVAPAEVWDALLDPEAIKQYMFGTNVSTSWKKGSPIIWHGEWEGKPYEDKGEILHIIPERTLQYSHFSPLSGLPDEPENYHTVTIELSGNENQTHVVLTQDNNPTEEAREHSKKNWEQMLNSLKEFVEK
jgi:uncharacterized protein YndB with AHSA1/START domain